MYFAVVYYPDIKDERFRALRIRYEPFADLLPPHVTFIFPLSQSVGREAIEAHIANILVKWEPFEVHFCTLEKSWDHWLYLGASEGKKKVINLHDDLYSGILQPYLRNDLPFYPHIALGHFGKESYDLHNPTAELTFDEKKFQKAKSEFEGLHLDLWCKIDHLHLLEVKDDFSHCRELTKLLVGKKA